MNPEALEEASEEEVRNRLANEAAIELIGKLQRRGANATEIAATFTHIAAAVCVGLSKAVPFPAHQWVELCTMRVRSAMTARLNEQEEATKPPTERS